MYSESAFSFFVSLGLNFFIHMTNAKKYAALMLNEANVIPYSDFVTYQKVRELLMSSKERYELLKDETDLPYADAGRYIDCMLEECGIMIKIHLSKTIPLEDLCLHIDEREKVDKDVYNKLFLPEIAPEDRKTLLDFQAKSDSRLDVMYAQILVINKMGL